MYSVILVLVGLASQALGECSRAMLKDAAAAYLQSQVLGKASLPKLASNASYIENDVPVDIKKGVLSQPITIDFNRTLYDTTQCAFFTEISAATNSHPYVIHTRVLFTGSQITTIESAVTDDGDWAFNATGELYWNKQETWDIIPESKRDSRAVLQAAADAYLDSWTNSSLPVPFTTPCARLEGGGYTGADNLTANTCSIGVFPVTFTVGKRRYVIDEEIGGVDVFDNFPWLDAAKPNGTTSSNFIRVEGGLIRYIHEVTVCSVKNCGR